MRHILPLFMALAAILVSCDDTTDTIGMSLSQYANQMSVNVSSAEFNVESRSQLVPAGSIVSRSSTGYLGKIKDPETNSYVTCNFMTQQRSMGTENQFPAFSELGVASVSEITADSCELCIYFPKYYGDSLALMNIVAHELNKPYEESETDITTTDFDPIEADKGISDPSQRWIRTGAGSIHQPLSYTIANHNIPDAHRESSNYTPYLSISLNSPYTDKSGETYPNYGTYLMRKYYEENSRGDFDNQYDFLHNICLGFYLETTGGLGSMATITVTQLLVHFKANVGGSMTDMHSSFAGTEEVLQKTSYSQEGNAALAADEGCTYLKTPAAIFTELAIPVDEIVYGHESDTLSTARIFIPRLNDRNTSSYNFPAPQEILLLPSAEVEAFFKEKKIADNRASYLTSYNSQYNGYVFQNVSELIAKLYAENREYIDQVNSAIKARMAEEGMTIDLIGTPEYNAKRKEVRNALFPDMKKFHVSVIPVETTYSTLSGGSLLTKVTYDLSLGSTRLAKGTGNFTKKTVNGVETSEAATSPITINVIYSDFKE